MGAGTLYGSLKRMLDAGLVKESDKRVDPEMDDRAAHLLSDYRCWRKALAAELDRYKRIVTLAQEKKLSLMPYNLPAIVALEYLITTYDCPAVMQGNHVLLLVEYS